MDNKGERRMVSDIREADSCLMQSTDYAIHKVTRVLRQQVVDDLMNPERKE
jgi:hypothetical protein